ncbi:MAG TPA: glycosyltransferase, partial [Chitinophagaceae bacterium]|nr:glycosyltransferase [Chitinophagaceae bacterium]
RHALVLPVFNKLIKEGYDIKILLLDEGEEKARLEQYVKDHGLTDRIFFLGFRRNITDYLSAVDLVVHPSQTEASSSLIKEAGMLKKPVIVCSGVGDFDLYIVHLENGFVVEPGDEAGEFEKYIRYSYENPSTVQSMGEALWRTVLETFSPRPGIIEMYLSKV